MYLLTNMTKISDKTFISLLSN